MTRAAFLHFLCSVLRFAGLALAAVFLLVATTFLFAVMLDWQSGEPWLANLTPGAICALIAWLFVAAFHLRPEPLVVPVDVGASFLRRVRLVLEDMGYEVTCEVDGVLYTRPRFHALLFGDGMQVTVRGREALILGPKILTEIVRSRLRIEQQLARVHAELHEDRRCTENVLKRVEISLRLQPHQLVDVEAELIRPLALKAEVACELSILVQSADGLRESMVDVQIRNWLRRRSIPTEIHKGHVKFAQSLHLAAAVEDEPCPPLRPFRAEADELEAPV